MIDILGWYSQNNCGDEAFKLAYDILFPGSQKNFLVAYMLNNENLILGGGDVIKQYYLDQVPDSKDFYCLGVGLGYESELELLAKKRVVEAFFRNRRDSELARAYGINAHYTPDIVFLLDKVPHAPIIESNTEKKKMGIFLSDAVNISIAMKDVAQVGETFYAEYMKWELASSLKELSQWYDLYFVPFSDASYSQHDLKIAWEVTDRFPDIYNNTSVIKDCYDPQKMINFISELDIVVTMKFHGVIFSILAEVPFVNIGLTRKTQLLCEEIELIDLSVAPYSFLKERFLKTVKLAETKEAHDKVVKVKSMMKENLKPVQEHLEKYWFS